MFEPISISVTTVLGGIFAAAKKINENVQRVKSNSNQCTLLLERITLITNALKPLSNNNSNNNAQLIPTLKSLQDCLNECNTFIIKLSGQAQWERLLNSDSQSQELTKLNEWLSRCVGLLNLSLDINKFTDPTLNLAALRKDNEELKKEFSNISNQQRIQMTLLSRMEAKLIDPRSSQEIRELKQAQAIHKDFLIRIEAAEKIIINEQKNQANKDGQEIQADLLKKIQIDLAQLLQKSTVKPDDITTIKHEQMLIHCILQEIQQDFQINKAQNQQAPSNTIAPVFSNYTNSQTSEAGILFEKGLAEKKQNNLDQAYNYFLQAAKLNHIAAKAHVGSQLLQGKGVSKDEVAAFGWLLEAAQGGQARAMYNVALMYEKAQGIPQDINAAKHWYSQAAAQNIEPEVAKHAKQKCLELSGQVLSLVI